MNRRDFFTRWAHTREPLGTAPSFAARPAAAGLEPYEPDAAAPWDAVRVGHLLRRTTFLPRWNDIGAFLAMTPSQAVDALLDTPSAPKAPAMADNRTESLAGLDTTYQDIVRGQWKNDATALRNWYTAVMHDAGLTLAEKMVGLWSNHFTSEFEVDLDYVVAPLLYRQNKLFREAGLGNFRQLVLAVTFDGAMLVYLGGNLNSAGKPNENYGRELMELFTMGIGYYTEGDVKEAARILTGWRVNQFSDEKDPEGAFGVYFEPPFHDVNAKQFMGVSFPARDSSVNTGPKVRQEEVEKLIDTIFEKRANEVARFICRKIYRFFVYSNPSGSDESVIQAMADLFIQNDFELKPVMAALLKSQHFFDNANIGAQIKTPAELVVGMARQLGTSRNLFGDMKEMGQELFDPPNVSGWPGYHDWITTTTYPVRASVAQSIVNALDDSEVLDFITQFPDHDDVNALVGNMAALLLPRPLSNGRKGIFVQKLVGGSPDYEWPNILSGSPATAARNMRDLLLTLVALPDFQLC